MLHIPRTKNEDTTHALLNNVALPALKAVLRHVDGKGRVFRSLKTGEPLENGRCDQGLAQEYPLARLAAPVCEPLANEGGAPRRYSGSSGTQEFKDGEASRTSRDEQTARSGVAARSKRHQN